MTWNIRKRLLGLSLLGLVLLLAVAGTGAWNLRRASETSRTMQRCVFTVRDQLELNLLNASIRADVLAVLAARTPADRDAEVGSLEQQAAKLQRFSGRAADE